MRFSIVLAVLTSLVTIEIVLQTYHRRLWGMSFAIDVILAVWIFWPLVKKVALAIGPRRA